MPAQREIRADFNRETIVVYQAYSPAVADAALSTGRFVAPFSFQRMTWIKPSFLWLMHRSNWGKKSGQERVLAVRISRLGWEKALSLAAPTAFDRTLHASSRDWEKVFASALVHVQWDPERSLRGAALQHDSIQIGVGRDTIREFVDEWIVRLEDVTPRVRKIHDLLRDGKADEASRHLLPERVYPVPEALRKRLGMDR